MTLDALLTPDETGPMTPEEFARLAEEAAHALGHERLDVRDLARALGRKRHTVYKYRSGDYPITSDLAFRLRQVHARALSHA